jgi:hypothetical protein
MKPINAYGGPRSTQTSQHGAIGVETGQHE